MHPTAPAAPAAVTAEDAVAAADDLTALIDHERNLHRQADAKATGAFAVVGLIIATASTVLPRLGGVALVLAAAALVCVVMAGLVLGFVLLPRTAPSRYRSPKTTAGNAVDRSRDPHRRLHERAVELANLEGVTEVKHTLIRIGLALLGLAFALALSASVTLAFA
jgi:hypothetical protein